MISCLEHKATSIALVDSLISLNSSNNGYALSFQPAVWKYATLFSKAARHDSNKEQGCCTVQQQAHCCSHSSSMGLTGSFWHLQLDSDTCSPFGGGDLPEDVLGGLNEAMNLFAGSADEAIVKFVVLIGDGPAHGRDCNNGLADR